MTAFEVDDRVSLTGVTKVDPTFIPTVPEYVERLRNADAAYVEKLAAHGLTVGSVGTIKGRLLGGFYAVVFDDCPTDMLNICGDNLELV